VVGVDSRARGIGPITSSGRAGRSVGCSPLRLGGSDDLPHLEAAAREHPLMLPGQWSDLPSR